MVDKLNDVSYAYHYRNLDSTLSYACRAESLSCGYDAGKAEALNNKAFVCLARMEYGKAEAILDSIPDITDNQVELLIADVQQMRLCQRMSRNKDYYDYNERAVARLRRIAEEEKHLSSRLRQRLVYAQSEYAIVSSTYYYYVGLERQSKAALKAIKENGEIQKDTAQYLNYLYNIGAGGIVSAKTREEVFTKEFDCLLKCLSIATQHGYTFFVANAAEALADHLNDRQMRQRMESKKRAAFAYINPDEVSSDSLAGFLADKALRLFSDYGDIYQIAGAHRTLASCFTAIGDYNSALYHLEKAIADSAIDQAPDLVASIREQLSIAYSAIDDKPASDYNRNVYLDLQEQTRQDRYFEARAEQLDKESDMLNNMIIIISVAICLLVFLLWLFNHLSRREMSKANDLEHKSRESRCEEIKDKCRVNNAKIKADERRLLEARAKVQLVNGVTPLIDRIVHEVTELRNADDDSERITERYEYISELAGKINEYNDVLTHWIELRKGKLSLNIESFDLKSVFNIVAKGKTTFAQKGIDLIVNDTDLTVKADRVLTLFMINTLADNARKNTQQGGKVTIEANDIGNMVEISVADTGVGIMADEIPTLFKHKVNGNHGFGLSNCKGIIESYRKTSKLFSECSISAESTIGKGSRFFFRLPKGVKRMMMAIVLMSVQIASWAVGTQHSPLLEQARAYADSAYYSNIAGTYEKTLIMADSCLRCLDGFDGDSTQMDYGIVLDIRNEAAVAALALHDWQTYDYNNKIYVQLFRELSADTTLPEYCRAIQRSQTNKTIAVIMLALILVAILPAYYLLYYRHHLALRTKIEQSAALNEMLLMDELAKSEHELGNLHVSNAVIDNCLSALKHETMYYPSRILQLIKGSPNIDVDALSGVVDYYRSLYSILSLQAVRQTERIRPKLKPLDVCGHNVIGNANMMTFLFELLRRQNNKQRLDVAAHYLDADYVEIDVKMNSLKLPADTVEKLFVPSYDNVPYLLCRQIVRDLSETTNRRGCGISAYDDDGVAIKIILPRYNNVNKTRNNIETIEV